MVEFKDLVGTQQNLDVAKGDRLLLEWLEAVKNEGELFFLSYAMQSEMNLSNHQGLLDDGRLVVMGRSSTSPVVVHIAAEPPHHAATKLQVDLDEYSFEGYMVGCNYAISPEEVARLFGVPLATINSLIPLASPSHVYRVSCEGECIKVMRLVIFREVLGRLVDDNCSEAIRFQEKLLWRGLESIFESA